MQFINQLSTSSQSTNGQSTSLSTNQPTSQFFSVAQKRLQDGGRTCKHLRDEIKLLSSVTVDESLQGLKDTVAMVLQDELSWQQTYESALAKYGIDASAPGPGMRRLRAPPVRGHLGCSGEHCGMARPEAFWDIWPGVAGVD